MSELLRVENITYRYDEKYVALHDITVAINAGERIAVLGGNGAGKSTFFLCCNGVLRPQAGKIFYRGKEITGAKKDLFALRQAVGLVFQDPDSQIIAGNVESEVSFGPMNLRLPEDEVKRRVAQALLRMNLSGYEHYAPHYLSGGEKKRVGIADILAMRPEIILLDEPTASLDPRNVDALERTLDELNGEGIAIVVSTHDVNFAYRVAERAIVFAGGEVIADAAVGEVFASERTLNEAGLKKPLLYEAYELIQSNFPNMQSRRKPATMEEFRASINAICPEADK